MAKNSGYFQDAKGNNSHSRLIGFLVVVVALLSVAFCLYLSYKFPEQAIGIIGVAGGLFTAMTAPTFLFLYNQKKNENEVSN